MAGTLRCEMMSVEEVMKDHGFNLAASCAGKASFTKWIKYRGKRAYIQAGGGIVADSIPAKEYQESVNKAKALIEAIAH